MDDTTKQLISTDVERERMDAEDRLLDDTSDGIDYQEIHRATQPDCEAGRYAFDSSNYPTEEAKEAAHSAFLQSVLDEVLRGIAARNPVDAPRS